MDDPAYQGDKIGKLFLFRGHWWRRRRYGRQKRILAQLFARIDVHRDVSRVLDVDRELRWFWGHVLCAFYALEWNDERPHFCAFPNALRTRTRARRDEFRGNEGDDTACTSNKRHFFAPILIHDRRSPSRAHKTFDETSPLAIRTRGLENRATVRTEHRERCLGWRPASVQNLYSLPDVHGERYMHGE